MNPYRRTKLVREGDYIAEVEVERIDGPSGWEPYLSVEDARKLDQVRSALKSADPKSAAGLAKIYRLQPVHAA